MTSYLLRNNIITDTAVGKLVTWVSVKLSFCLEFVRRLGCSRRSRTFSISSDESTAGELHCHTFMHDELCCFSLKHVCLLCGFVAVPSVVHVSKSFRKPVITLSPCPEFRDMYCFKDLRHKSFHTSPLPTLLLKLLIK